MLKCLFLQGTFFSYKRNSLTNIPKMQFCAPTFEQKEQLLLLVCYGWFLRTTKHAKPPRFTDTDILVFSERKIKMTKKVNNVNSQTKRNECGCLSAYTCNWEWCEMSVRSSKLDLWLIFPGYEGEVWLSVWCFHQAPDTHMMVQSVLQTLLWPAEPLSSVPSVTAPGVAGSLQDYMCLRESRCNCHPRKMRIYMYISGGEVWLELPLDNASLVDSMNRVFPHSHGTFNTCISGCMYMYLTFEFIFCC